MSIIIKPTRPAVEVALDQLMAPLHRHNAEVKATTERNGRVWREVLLSKPHLLKASTIKNLKKQLAALPCSSE